MVFRSEMQTYRFEVTAHEEIDIEAENRKEAEEKAKAYWADNFGTMFGGVEFKEVVDE